MNSPFVVHEHVQVCRYFYCVLIMATWGSHSPSYNAQILKRVVLEYEHLEYHSLRPQNLLMNGMVMVTLC